MELIFDAFTERRGEPVLLELFCAKCAKLVLLYQKDGPGPLLRCYLDRIHGPQKGVYMSHPPEDLLCPACHTLLGKLGTYEKENRLAFFLEEGTLLSQKK